LGTGDIDGEARAAYTTRSKTVGGADNSHAAFVEYVGVNHGGGHVLVAE
jgi:hypothetical protein